MPKTKKKRCQCKIRGVFTLWKDIKGVGYMIHPRDWYRYLRRFRFCPICGR